jgi:uncharacterized protein YgiM (DUF1202 family)
MTRPGDPKGYYARLGVATWATQQAIDIAFRVRSHELQPGSNQSPDAAERYQAVVEAHRVLSDEISRRAYDDAALPDADDGGAEAPQRAIAPMPWFRRQPVLMGLGASVAVVLILIALIRAPDSVAPSPARALTPPPVPLAPRLERRVVAASGVNLRHGPGTHHAQSSRIARGELVDLLQPEADGWVRVRLNDGRTGYIAARYLTAP